MTHIETVASDVALMSNHSLAELAQQLIHNYPTRAAALTTFLTVYEQDQSRTANEDLECA